jgi:uncharacterized protein YeaO (DUF488 family)
MIKTKRFYEPGASSDGYRVLIDGLWPRGVKKADARLDEWLKEIAPSRQLRTWFDHRTERWAEFERRYKEELAAPEKAAQLKRLKKIAKSRTLTILYGAREERYNNAVVVAELLRA